MTRLCPERIVGAWLIWPPPPVEPRAAWVQSDADCPSGGWHDCTVPRHLDRVGKYADAIKWNDGRIIR